MISLAAVLALFASGIALAQSGSGMTDKPASLQNGGNSGTSQDGGMGATGWSGPHRGQTGAGADTNYVPTPSTDRQPLVATGTDLNGPPVAFPSNKAPE